MSPYAALGALVLAAGSLGGAYWLGRMDGANQCRAQEARDLEVAGIAAEATAKAISRMKVNHVTVTQKLERETRVEPVYVDCRHTADGLRALNAALAGPAADPGELPAADAAR